MEIISKSLIQASNPTQESPQKLDLTPWDLQFLLVGPIQKGLLFHKPNSTIIYHLKTTFSRALDFFPPLAGRLATQRGVNTSSFYLDCNNKGALFVHALANEVSVSDIIEPIYVPEIVHSFFQLNETKNIDATSEPILAVQVTELIDGIFIGCTCNHAVVDGPTFWHFFNSWSEISRGSTVISKSPVFHRSFDGIEFPIQIPTSKIEQIHNNFVPTPFKERIFHFSKEKIAKLKAKANSQMGTHKISSLQSLLSHLWIHVFRVKNVTPDTKVHYRLLIGARSRLESLPERYFGTAVQVGSVTMTAKTLVEGGLGNAALEMNKIVALHNKEKATEFLGSWAKTTSFFMMGGVVGNGLGTSGSPRFNVYGNDFGWGKPVSVRSGAANKSDGKITVFCGAEEGSIDVEACLLPETLEALGNDQDFMAI